MNTDRYFRRVAVVTAVTMTMLTVAERTSAVASTSGATSASHDDRAARRRAVDVTLRVVDDNGARLAGAVIFACPYEQGVANCDRAVGESTKRNGRARLRLRRGVRYDINAFVEDPDPAWACPGLVRDGHERYFATNSFAATPDQIDRRTPLVIPRPTPYECVTVRVTDDAGDPLTTAGMFVCPLAPDGTPCAGPTFDGPDADGLIRLDLEPTLTYRLNAFISDSGWPCPDYLDPGSGTTFHFSPTRDIAAADLANVTTTFVIRHPDAAECAPPVAAAIVTVNDDAGNPLPSAGMFVCRLSSDGTPCPGPSFDGPDPDGVIRLDAIDPNVTYRLNAFIANSGWPCPDYVDPGGATFHFSPARDIAGRDLLGHTETFVIHHPAPDECIATAPSDDTAPRRAMAPFGRDATSRSAAGG
jgi:hypothetical protein